MKFAVYPVRDHGRVMPKHVRWGRGVLGELYITERRDLDVNRTSRVAVITGADRTELLPALHDVTLLSAKPDWWTMTGWELMPLSTNVEPTAFQQSWILIPEDQSPDYDKVRLKTTSSK